MDIKASEGLPLYPAGCQDGGSTTLGEISTRTRPYSRGTHRFRCRVATTGSMTPDFSDALSNLSSIHHFPVGIVPQYSTTQTLPYHPASTLSTTAPRRKASNQVHNAKCYCQTWRISGRNVSTSDNHQHFRRIDSARRLEDQPANGKQHQGTGLAFTPQSLKKKTISHAAFHFCAEGWWTSVSGPQQDRIRVLNCMRALVRKCGEL